MKKVVSKSNNLGFILEFLLCLFVLFVILGVSLFVILHRVSLHGPSFPKLSTYHSIDEATINSKSILAQSEITKDIQIFQKAFPSLIATSSETFDGCGLFTTKANGDFSAAYGKMCSLYQQSYYASSESVPTIMQSMDKWFHDNYARSESSIVPSSQQCVDVSINNYDDINDIAAYTFNPALEAADKLKCDGLAKLDTATPTFTSEAMLAGAVGADKSYQEVHKQISVNRETVLNQMRKRGAQTVIVVQWSKRYYSHTF